MKGPKPKIFCIGLNKTGTSSLHTALLRLGYRSFHHHAGEDDDQRLYRAIRDGRPMFHYFNQEFDAYSDLSGLTKNFALADQQYPNSKFILTVRDLDSWLDSRDRHVQRNIQRKRDGSYEGKWLHFDFSTWEKRWHIHHQKVMDYFGSQAHKLLILDVCGGEGYSQLCPFLEKSILREPFPWKNQGKIKQSGKLNHQKCG